MSEALRLADRLDLWGDQGDLLEASAELRRLHAENKAMRAELAEQARVNGMGGEREARLLALNAELVEALRKCDEAMAWDFGGEPMDTLMVNARNAARAALAKAQGEMK